MPLRCVDDAGSSIQSHLLDEHQWAALKASHAQKRHLRMPCCHELAVLKTSKLGTRFFAHYRRGLCTTKPESAEHLLLKSIVAQAIAKCGWTVETEVRGQTNEGEEWIADVLARKKNNRIAVEIQWSRQTDIDTYARQARYKQSGVRGLWLFKQRDFPTDYLVPALQVVQEAGEMFVTIPTDDINPLRLSVSDFIHHAFTGRFWYGVFRPNTHVKATMYGGFMSCWKCGSWTNVVSEVELLHPRNERFVDIPIAELAELPSLMPQLPLEQGIPHKKVGKIQMRYSKTVGGRYLANGCVNCNALQGNFFLNEIAHRLKPIFSTNVLISAELHQSLQDTHGYACSWNLNLPEP